VGLFASGGGLGHEANAGVAVREDRCDSNKIDTVKQVAQPEVDAVSIADAAKLLFVSRLHVVKLVEQEKLKLHHKSGNDRFITEPSVLAYQAQQRVTARVYQASIGDNE
jgi:hypothetical protein